MLAWLLLTCPQTRGAILRLTRSMHGGLVAGLERLRGSGGRELVARPYGCSGLLALLGEALVDGPAGALQGAVHWRDGRLERLRHLAGGEAEHMLSRPSSQRMILSRALEPHGRPVAFAFKGAPPSPDGSEVFLDAELLEQGFNYKSVADGHAYPLFYDTLFVDLRNALTAAAVAARAAKLGLWAEDRSHSSLRVIDQAGLEQDGVVFPKLLRRLSEFRDLPSPTSPGSCPGSGEARAGPRPPDEQLHALRQRPHFGRRRVRLVRQSEEIVFVSAKTANPAVAPWLAV
jgi:hypothetical protein